MPSNRTQRTGTTADLTTLSAKQLAGLGRRALASGERAQWRACLRELERRGSKAADEAAEKLRSLSVRGAPAVRSASTAKTSASPPRAWITRVARIAQGFQPDAGGGKGRDYSVYMALLVRDEEFGVYVGLTHLTPEARFSQHKRGVKSGRGHVRKHGVRLLHEVARHLIGTLSWQEAKRIERRLHARVKATGIWAEGGH